MICLTKRVGQKCPNHQAQKSVPAAFRVLPFQDDPLPCRAHFGSLDWLLPSAATSSVLYQGQNEGKFGQHLEDQGRQVISATSPLSSFHLLLLMDDVASGCRTACEQYKQLCVTGTFLAG